MGSWYIGERKGIKRGDLLLPPIIGYKKDMACIYRLNFKKGYFYIGSTGCFDRRMSAHRRGENNIVGAIGILTKWSNLVSVEILRTGKDVKALRRSEEKMIKKIFLGFACLNTLKTTCRK